jgi:hypothetical protein
VYEDPHETLLDHVFGVFRVARDPQCEALNPAAESLVNFLKPDGALERGRMLRQFVAPCY